MKYTTDHDGKSKTGSAADAQRYPEQHEVKNSGFEEADSLPSHDEIAKRAMEIWNARGCPEGSADRDWLQAEGELRAALNSRAAIQSSSRQSGGSVQR
jgi:hypothetical protein